MVLQKRQKSFEKIAKELEIYNYLKQPLKDYCYGFVLMQDGDGAMSAVTELKQNSPLGTTWTVAFSKDKNDDISGTSHQKKDDPKKDSKNKRKEKEKSKERQKKTKSKNKDKKKRKSESSSSSDSSKSRGKSSKKGKKQKKKRISSSSESSASKLPTRSALIKIEPKQNDLMGMIFMDSGDLQQHLLPQQTVLFQSQQPQSNYQVKHMILVRELFISGIPQNKSQSDIQRIFSQYGIVERTDIMQKTLVNYAYVKFKRLESVVIAIQNSSIIADLLESNGQVKIYNSDPFRRVQVVGNHEDCEKDDEMIPVMFIGYPPSNGQTVDEKHLKKLAERYGGPVKGIQHVLPDQPQLRSYILIEFQELRDCKKARRKFCHYKVQILGDKRCDVAILSNLPISMQNKRNTPMFPQQQQQQQFGVNPQMQMYNPMMVRQIPNQPLPNYQNPMFGYDNQSMMYQQPQTQQQMLANSMFQQLSPSQQLQQIQPPTILQRQQNQLQATQQSLQQQGQQQTNNFRNPLSNQASLSPPVQAQNYYQQQNYQQMNKQDPIQQQQQFLQQQFQMEMPITTQKMEENINVFWSGFMNRGRQHKVGIDARIINVSMDIKKVNLPHNLEMSFKCTYQDALNKAQTQPSTTMVFVPSSEIEYSKFSEYVQYLKSKNRAGVIQSDEFTIYVIPSNVPEGQQLYAQFNILNQYNASQYEMIAIYCSK